MLGQVLSSKLTFSVYNVRFETSQFTISNSSGIVFGIGFVSFYVMDTSSLGIDV